MNRNYFCKEEIEQNYRSFYLYKSHLGAPKLQKVLLNIENKKVRYYEFGNKENPSIVCFHGLADIIKFTYYKNVSILS